MHNLALFGTLFIHRAPTILTCVRAFTHARRFVYSTCTDEVDKKAFVPPEEGGFTIKECKTNVSYKSRDVVLVGNLGPFNWRWLVLEDARCL